MSRISVYSLRQIPCSSVAIQFCLKFSKPDFKKEKAEGDKNPRVNN